MAKPPRHVIWQGSPADLARHTRDFLDALSETQAHLAADCRQFLQWALDHHAHGTKNISVVRRGRRHYPIAHT